MYGIDIEINRKVLLQGGNVIAVLGHGINYPVDVENNNLYNKMIDKYGLFISESKDKSPKPFRYLLRNRIVVGLSEMVIVVEAGENSGSIHSAEWGRRLGRKVWAVPGSLDSKVSEGTNGLIQRGQAEILTWKIFDEYLRNNQNISNPIKTASTKNVRNFTESQINLLSILSKSGPLSTNDLSRELAVNTGAITSDLIMLSIAGLVKQDRGVWTC